MSTLLYSFRLVGKSLRRDRWFTVVMLVSQALSVSLFVTALVASRRHAQTAGQVRSDVFRVDASAESTLARFFQHTQFEGFADFTTVLVGVGTARALARTGLPSAETSIFLGLLTGSIDEGAPRRIPTRFCSADLFDIFNVEFRYGGPWRRDQETGASTRRVTVLSDVANQELFGGADSVGRTVRLAGQDFRVVGVIRQRPGSIQLWDLDSAAENLANVSVPSLFADALQPEPVLAWPPVVGDPVWSEMAHSQTAFVEYWVRLPTADARHRFGDAMRALDPRLVLRSADEIVARYSLASPSYRAFLIFTLILMEASVINTARMLLAKSSARAGEIGIHRALGAEWRTIFVRQLLEGVLISIAGSLLGIALSLPTMALIDWFVSDSPVHMALTPATAAIALIVSLLAALLSGLYPAWRAASVRPTRYLGGL